MLEWWAMAVHTPKSHPSPPAHAAAPASSAPKSKEQGQDRQGHGHVEAVHEVEGVTRKWAADHEPLVGHSWATREPLTLQDKIHSAWMHSILSQQMPRTWPEAVRLACCWTWNGEAESSSIVGPPLLSRLPSCFTFCSHQINHHNHHNHQPASFLSTFPLVFTASPSHSSFLSYPTSYTFEFNIIRRYQLYSTSLLSDTTVGKFSRCCARTPVWAKDARSLSRAWSHPQAPPLLHLSSPSFPSRFRSTSSLHPTQFTRTLLPKHHSPRYTLHTLSKPQPREGPSPSRYLPADTTKYNLTSQCPCLRNTPLRPCQPPTHRTAVSIPSTPSSISPATNKCPIMNRLPCHQQQPRASSQPEPCQTHHHRCHPTLNQPSRVRVTNTTCTNSKPVFRRVPSQTHWPSTKTTLTSTAIMASPTTVTCRASAPTTTL